MTERMPGPVPLLIETDLCDDVDDVGALAVAHALADAGEVSILGVGVNTTGHWSLGAAQVVNAFYGRPQTPVGIRQPTDESTGPEDYAKALTRLYPDLVGLPRDTAAVPMLRRALAGAGDDSVTLVSIGYLGNLIDLLDSTPDSGSPLAGRELVRAKVRRTLTMGGQFDVVAMRDHAPEFNFAGNPEATARFVEEWPHSIDFVGWETGWNIVTGSTLTAAQGADSPVAIAYALHSGDRNGRSSWDLLTVALSTPLFDDLVDFGEPGTVSVDREGRSTWTAAPGGRHRVARVRGSIEETADRLDRWLCAPPASTAWLERTSLAAVSVGGER
ncbi:nucleoside hydrolase [Leifsonia poae]|uniref:nucleoside hydrolase n=1 Tax=Leifsonia poae TaxID=110933 RepID=UPI001CBDE33B|nr:nucleoside hydrolase [Leifsonia poae]